MMDKIAIFCSASENIEPVFFEKARELGVWMGQNKKTLVYGGANIGLMECIAKAAKDNGSMIMGVIPTKLEERGRASDLVDVTFRTDNLSDRKDVMLNESDVVIALPGGVGTLDEVFHVMAAATLDYHRKKVIFYNIFYLFFVHFCHIRDLSSCIAFVVHFHDHFPFTHFNSGFNSSLFNFLA